MTRAVLDNRQYDYVAGECLPYLCFFAAKGYSSTAYIVAYLVEQIGASYWLLKLKLRFSTWTFALLLAFTSISIMT